MWMIIGVSLTVLGIIALHAAVYFVASQLALNDWRDMLQQSDGPAAMDETTIATCWEIRLDNYCGPCQLCRRAASRMRSSEINGERCAIILCEKCAVEARELSDHYWKHKH